MQIYNFILLLKEIFLFNLYKKKEIYIYIIL